MLEPRGLHLSETPSSMRIISAIPGTRRTVMARVVAHCLCRTLEVLIVLGVLGMALIIDNWTRI